MPGRHQVAHTLSTLTRRLSTLLRQSFVLSSTLRIVLSECVFAMESTCPTIYHVTIHPRPIYSVLPSLTLLRLLVFSYLTSSSHQTPPIFILRFPFPPNQIWAPHCTDTFSRSINQSMGNHISCVSLSANPSKMVKIVHMSFGSLQEFEGPMKAAEVMLENPQHFVCHSNALQMGRRIAALPADQDLQNGETYFVIPIPKLHSQLSPAERAFLTAFVSPSNRNTKRRRSIALAKILPLSGDLWELPPAKNNDNGGVSKGQGDRQETVKIVVPKLHLDGLPEEHLALGKPRLRVCRNWKPLLDTISESPRLLQS